MFKHSVTTLALCLVSLSFAQPELEWENHYGSDLIGECCYSVLQTYDNGFVLSGYVSNQRHEPRIDVDYFLVKTDENGQEIWTGTYGTDDRDYGRGAISTPDSGFIMGGYSLVWDEGLCLGLVVKTDREGNEDWSVYFHEDVFGMITPIALHPDGGYLIGGTTGDAWDYKLVYLDEDGETVWSREYGGRGAEDCYGLCVTSDGGFALVGVTTSFGEGSFDSYLIKTDEDGEEEWSQTYGGEGEDFSFNLIQTSDGGFCLVGGTESFGAGRRDVYIVRTDEDGEEIWSRTYGGRWDDVGNDIIEVEDGGFVVGGYSRSFNGANSNDFYMLRVDSEGDSIWQVSIGDRHHSEEANSLIRTINGGFALAGVTRAFGGNDFWLVKYGHEPLSWLSLPDAGFIEDSSLIFSAEYLLDRVYPYIYRDSVLVFTVAEHDYLSAEFEDDTLTISAEPDYCGTDSLGLIVAEEREDGGCDTIYIDLTILPLNDLPDDFTLINPPDSVVIGSWVETFTWGQAIQNEWEVDPLRYHLYFRAEGSQNGYWNLQDTVYADLTMQRLASRLGITLGQSDVEVEWWVAAHDDSGYTECADRFTFIIPVTGVSSSGANPIPTACDLTSLYPNPFNAATRISYEIPELSKVYIGVYDICGRLVETLVDGDVEAGYHLSTWKALNAPSGVYFCRMKAKSFEKSIKLVLMR